MGRPAFTNVARATRFFFPSRRPAPRVLHAGSVAGTHWALSGSQGTPTPRLRAHAFRYLALPAVSGRCKAVLVTAPSSFSVLPASPATAERPPVRPSLRAAPALPDHAHRAPPPLARAHVRHRRSRRALDRIWGNPLAPVWDAALALLDPGVPAASASGARILGPPHPPYPPTQRFCDPCHGPFPPAEVRAWLALSGGLRSPARADKLARVDVTTLWLRVLFLCTSSPACV
ncbi:hypothetical protein AcW1_009598 [Taiwanofungus camphoratus]|nr:hypothetical protein AcW1_009598 [Antrodia cinnamomea]